MVVALLVLAVAMAAGAVASVRSAEPNTGGGETPAAPAPRAALVVGDSWSIPGPLNDGRAWPDMIDHPENWTILTNAVGGSGYTGDSPLTPDRLAEVQADYRPDLVLMALGRNDVTQPLDEVLRVARVSLTTLQRTWPNAEIVVLSPFSPGQADEGTAALTGGLRDLADTLGLEFIDVSRVIDSPAEQIKDLHPNADGQRAIVKKLDVRLASLGVFSDGAESD